MIIALAGRRIDPPDVANPAFPLANIDAVRTRLREFFQAQSAAALVCSAACGADLLALDVAGALGIRRRVILPFTAERFRETSVTDRPGDWGSIFDRVIADARSRSDLLIINSDSDDDAAYALVNIEILNQAAALATALNDRPIAVLAWEGIPRNQTDLTQAFGIAAGARKMPVIELMTL